MTKSRQVRVSGLIEWWGRTTDEDAFSVEEAADFRALLRRVGEQRFLDQTVRNNAVKAKKLITAFGIRPVRNFPS